MNHNHHLFELPEVLSGDSLILNLQNALLSSGMHEFSVASFSGSRSLFFQLLDSLPIIPAIGYLSQNVPEDATNIFKDLMMLAGSDEDAVSIELVEEYLLYHLCVDIIIVESTNELLAKPWFSLLCSLLEQLHFSTTVIILRLV